jgi:F-type H+-transporting ATPase subunit a
MRKRTFWILVAIIVLPVVLAGIAPKHTARQAHDPLSEIGEHPPYIDLATGTVHLEAAEGAEEAQPPLTALFFYRLLFTWIVFGLILLFAHRATRKFAEVPSRVQGAGELVVGFFDGLAKDTLGSKARKYFPLVTTLFIFILISNWLGMLPRVWEYLGVYIGSIVALVEPNVHVVGNRFLTWSIEVPDGHWLAFIAKLPHIEEPTADLNTTLGCGLIVFVTAHAAGIKYAGFKEYFRSTYCEIDIPVVKYFPGVLLGILGEIGKLVSHSFRLFGNILGGTVVIMVVVSLLMRVVYFLPLGVFVRVGLDLFLGLFVGLVQAFVFAMLAMVYIAIKMPVEE